MKRNKDKTKNVLIEIRYQYSMNRFEQEYGECVNYDQLIQETYVELKDIVNKEFNRKVKFRKYGPREGMVRTVRAEMYDNEFFEMEKIYTGKTFSFICDFVVSNVRLMSEELQ